MKNREYGRNGFQNMSEEDIQGPRKYQKNYRQAKKST